MEISIRGIKRSNLSRYRLERATRFIASRLMSSRLTSKLKLTIKIDPDSPYGGLCTWLDDHRRPREFSITLNPRDDELVSLAHELVHVRQFAREELRDLISDPDLVNYRGKRYRTSDFKTKNQMKVPWEIEPYERQVELANEFEEYEKKCRTKLHR